MLKPEGKNLLGPEILHHDLLKKIIDDSIDGFFVLTDDYRILQYNSAFQGIFSDHELSSRDTGFLNIVDDHSRRDLRHKLQIVSRQKKSESAEFLLSRGGVKKYFLISLNPLWQSASERYLIYGFIKDITMMKNLQNQIENEKNYNRNIIETVKLGFVLVDDNNRYLDYNKEYLVLLGRNESELKDRTFYDFTLPKYRAEQLVLMKEMIRTGKPFIYEKELVRKDGTLLPVILSMSRLLDRDGKPIGNFAFIRDISDQKKSEKELIEQNIRFQNLIEIYNSISARYLVCETVNDVYKSLTNEIYKIIGPDAIEILTSDGLAFKTAYSINPVTRGGRSSLDDRVSLVISKLASKKSPLVIKDNSTGLNDEDRTAFPGLLKMKSSIFLPALAKNAISGIVVLGFKRNIYTVDDIQMNILMGIANLATITIDKIVSINEQSMMTRELERFERLTAMGRIIAGVAHEINNPLSIMQLDIDELKNACEMENLVPARTVRDMAASLQEEISRLTGIVKQLKDYSNPASTGSETINVDDILKAYPVKIFLKNLQKKGITVEMRLNASKSIIQVPKNRLIQVLMNLFANADDAVENTSSPLILIETGRVFREKDMVFISVKDNGLGIPEENIQKIFEPFFTSKKSEGTGLGLSISYSIVKSYNGFITVSSVEGDGAEFRVFFPESGEE